MVGAHGRWSAEAEDGGWVVQVLVERPDGEASRGVDALSTLVNALPVPAATVSWQSDHYLLEVPVAATGVREAMTVALELSIDARRQAGLGRWPVRSCVVLDAVEYALARAVELTGAPGSEPGRGPR